MKSAVFLAVLSAAVGALGQNPLMNTPSTLVTCQPVQLSWSGGKPPYFISIQDGNNPNGNALFRFDEQSGTQLTWTVNFQPGTSIGFLLRDSNGATSPTSAVIVQAGSSTDCIGKSASVSGGQTNTGGSGQPPQTGGSSNTNTATTTAPTNSNGSPTTSSGGSQTSGSSGSSNNNNAASVTSAQIGAAGLAGAAVLALLA